MYTPENASTQYVPMTLQDKECVIQGQKLDIFKLEEELFYIESII